MNLIVFELSSAAVVSGCLPSQYNRAIVHVNSSTRSVPAMTSQYVRCEKKTIVTHNCEEVMWRTVNTTWSCSRTEPGHTKMLLSKYLMYFS